MESARPDAATEADLNRQLRAIGRAQQMFCLGAWLFVALIVLFVGPVWDVVLKAAVVTAASVPLLLSLRIRVRVASESMFVRGYVGTREFGFSRVEAFEIAPYEGWWNGGVGTTGWLNLNLGMVVVVDRNGRDVDLPVTMCSVNRGSRIVAALNGRLRKDVSGVG